MSQIQKYENGGGTEKPKVRTIKRGNEDIDLDRYIRNLEYNFDKWIDSRKMSDEEKQQVREAYVDMLNGYNDGSITAELGGISHNTDEASVDRRKNADKGFDAYGKAQDYFNLVLQKQDAYTAPAKAKFDKRKSWNDYLTNQDIPYNTFRQMSQDEQNQYLLDLLTDYTGSIKGDDYEDFDSNYGQSVLDLFNSAIADPTLTPKERMDLSRVGIDLSKFYDTEESEDDGKSDMDKRIEEIEKQEKEREQRRRVNAYLYRDQLKAMQLDPSKVRDYSRVKDYRTILPTDAVYDQDIYNNGLATRSGLFADYIMTGDLFSGNARPDLFSQGRTAYKLGDGTMLGYLNKDYDNLSNPDKVLAYQKAYALDWLKYIKQNQQEEANRKITSSYNSMFDGWYVIDSSFNNRGTVTVMNPQNTNMQEIPVRMITSTAGVQNYLDAYIQKRMEQDDIPDLVSSNKQGGILKAQFGGNIYDTGETLSETIDRKKAQNEKAKKDAEEAKISKKMSDTGKNRKQVIESQRELGEGLTSVDKARMASIAVDLGSAVASFTGVGSVAGGVGGLAGTALSTYADWNDDAVTKTELVKNTLLGLGLSAIGFIPVVGGAGKFANFMGKAIKYVPKLFTLAASGSLLLDDDVLSSLKKFQDVNVDNLSNPKEWFKKNNITNDDLRNLAMAMGAAAGITRAGNNSIKKRIVKHNTIPASTSDKYTIKVKNGKTTQDVILSEQQYKAISEAPNLTEQNRLLKSIPGQENSSIITRKKYGLFGSKKFKKSSLDQKTVKEGYVLDPEFEQTAIGKLYLGEVGQKGHDIDLIMRQLNHTYDPFKGGLFFRRKSKQQQVPAVNPTPQRQLLALPPHTNSSSPTVTPSVNPTVTPSSNNIPSAVPPIINPAGIPRLGMPRTFQLADGRIATNLKYGGQSLDVNNIRQLVNSGKFHFLNKSDVKSLIPGANNAIQSIDRPDLIYFWKKGGRLPFKYASGGSIQKFDGGGAVSNTTYGTGYSWDDIIYNTDYFKNVLKGLNKDNFEAANALQNRYYTDKINDKWSESKLGKRDTVSKYQTDFNTAYGANLNSGAIEDAISKGIIKRVGTTGDNATGKYTDGYSGSMTNLRHLGTSEHSKYLSAMNEILKGQNLEAFVNPTTQMINYRLLQTPETTPASSTEKPKTGPSSQIKADKTEEVKYEPQPAWKHSLYQLTPKLLGISRYLGTLATNRNIYNTKRKSIRPDILETYELYHPIRGDYASRMFYNDQAGQIRSKANQPFTSDASLQAAYQLDANKQAREQEEKGLLVDNQEIRRTEAENIKRKEDNIARRTDIANRNRASLNNTRQILGQLKADYQLKQWNATSGLLSEYQSEALDNLNRYRNFILSSDDEAAKQAYKDAIAPIEDELRAVRRAHANDPNFDITQDPVYQKYRETIADAAVNLLNTTRYSQSSLFGLPYNPIRRQFNLTKV